MYELLLVAGPIIWLSFAVLYLRRGIASIYHPATYYLAFHGFVFVVRPLFKAFYDYRFIYNFYGFLPTPADQARALAVADLGFIVFMSVVLWIGSVPMRFPPPNPQRERATYSARLELVVACALCAPVALFSLYRSLGDRFSESSSMVYDAGTGITYNTDTVGYLTDANNMLAPIAVLIAWQFRFRWWSLLPFAGYIASRVMVGGGRWTFIMASAALALLFLYSHRQKWFTLPIAAGGAALLLVFSIVGEQRDFFLDMIRGDRVELVDSGLAPLEGMDFGNQEYLEFLVQTVPERTGTYAWFLGNLQLFTEPIPRALWPNKPLGAPIKSFDLFDYGNPVGMTSSIAGVGWVNGGYFGVILWCGLFGWIYGRIYRWFVFSRQTPAIVAVYAMILPVSIQMFRDGSLITFVKFPLFFLLPILVWRIIIRLNRGAAAARAPLGYRGAELPATPSERRAMLARQARK
ncbi:MAG: oligosaccharide repeat unit polymerase [Novosphingobium sp.]|nr:oligosaccharide repeat unit polymerase [Novosphingobium sp.]